MGTELEKVNKETGEVVPMGRTQPAKFDPFQAMDSLDDEAIMAEIEGRVVDKWVYHFPSSETDDDGQRKEVWGLSKVGVDQAALEMARSGEVLREEDVEWTTDPTDSKYVLFKAFAKRVAVSKDGKEVILDQVVGVKRQCLFFVKYGKISQKQNAFWFEQGSMKAMRNARSRLISEEVRSKIMALAKDKGKVKKVVDVQAEPLAEESNETLDQSIHEQEVKKDHCLCGAKLSEKAIDYYKKNPNREKICYDCNQLKKADKPYGRHREREAGQEG